MLDNKLITYHLKGEYLFDGQKGTQTGKIYLNKNNEFIGKVTDSDSYSVVKLVCGKLTNEKLSFFKIPEDNMFSPVFWFLNKTEKGLNYEGNFFFLSSSIQKKEEMYASLEKSLELFKNGNFEKIGDIEKEMFKDSEESLEEWIKKQPFSANGSGNISLEVIDKENSSGRRK